MYSLFFVYNAIKTPCLTALGLYYKRIMQEYWRETNPKTCHICKRNVAYRDRSVDHLIPKSVCFELDMIGLIYDKRNFAIAHEECNSKRSSNVSDLPESVLAKLKTRGYIGMS